MNNRESGGHTALKITALVLAVLAAVFASLIWFKMNGQRNTSSSLAQQGITIGAGPAQEMVLDAAQSDSSIVETEVPVSVTGKFSYDFPAGQTNIPGVNFENSIDNKDLYNLSFALYIAGADGNAECLYSSDYVTPGNSIKDIVISRPLAAGEYDAVLVINPARIKDGSPTNNVEVPIKINVK